MKKVQKKSLRLDTQTLRVLTKPQLEHAAGGFYSQTLSCTCPPKDTEGRTCTTNE